MVELVVPTNPTIQRGRPIDRASPVVLSGSPYVEVDSVLDSDESGESLSQNPFPQRPLLWNP